MRLGSIHHQFVWPMLLRCLSVVAALFPLVAASGSATAHPHVWVSVKSEIIYGPDGSATGISNAWTFDDAFSAFAVQGLDQKTKGEYTREELGPLAEENAKGLKEFDYFTHATANGKKTAFNDPVDYWLEYADERLTLHFLLPFKAPVKTQDLELQIFDPTFFVAFGLAEKNPVALVGAPAECKLAFARPPDVSQVAQGQQLDEAFFNQLDASSNWGAQFANKISITCP
jgi:ABC-type uncharacterized transport system substrate-binding protein